MPSAAQIVRQYLVNSGVAGEPGQDPQGQGDWKAFTNRLPVNPNNVIVAADTPAYQEGRVMEGVRIVHPIVNLTIRATDDQVGIDKGQEVEFYFDQIGKDFDGSGSLYFPIVVIDATGYIIRSANVTSTTTKISQEEQSRRAVFNLSVQLTIEEALAPAPGEPWFYTRSFSFNPATSYLLGFIDNSNQVFRFLASDLLAAAAGIPVFHWAEIPAGAVNGINLVFTLVAPPAPPVSLQLMLNGLVLRPGVGNDFTLAGNVITFQPGALPHAGDVIEANYTT